MHSMVAIVNNDALYTSELKGWIEDVAKLGSPSPSILQASPCGLNSRVVELVVKTWERQSSSSLGYSIILLIIGQSSQKPAFTKREKK